MALEFKGLHINIADRELFKLNDLTIFEGLYALVGRNGTGKTTFLNTILGNRDDYAGEINIEGRQMPEYSNEDLAKSISVVFTKAQVFGSHSVYDVLSLGRLPYQNVFASLSSTDISKIDEIIELLDLNDFKEREFSSLSDGEKQMVMIGRALVQDTKILILDEPGAFLDIVNRYKMMAVLKDIAEKTNKLILFSTHHVDMVQNYCDGLLIIANGELKYFQEQNEFQAIIHETFGL